MEESSLIGFEKLKTSSRVLLLPLPSARQLNSPNKQEPFKTMIKPTIQGWGSRESAILFSTSTVGEPEVPGMVRGSHQDDRFFLPAYSTLTPKSRFYLHTLNGSAGDPVGLSAWSILQAKANKMFAFKLSHLKNSPTCNSKSKFPTVRLKIDLSFLFTISQLTSLKSFFLIDVLSFVWYSSCPLPSICRFQPFYLLIIWGNSEAVLVRLV